MNGAFRLLTIVLLWKLILATGGDSVVYKRYNLQEKHTTTPTRIFLDHGGLFFHSEVFYPVAVLLTQRLYSSSNLTFVVHKQFAQRTGLLRFWQKHATEGILGKIGDVILMLCVVHCIALRCVSLDTGSSLLQGNPFSSKFKRCQTINQYGPVS